MIFDALRAIAHNWLAEIRLLVDAATLIHLPVTPHEILPRGQDLEIMSKASVDFRLPHPITAVEDNASCVVLIDPQPGLVGLAEQRLFIDCVPLHADEDCYNDTPLDRAACESLKTTAVTGVYGVSFGRISSPAQRAGSWLAAGDVMWVVTGTTSRQHATAADFNALPEAATTAMTHASLRNAMTATTAVTVKFDDQAVADYADACVDAGLEPQQFMRIWVHTHPGQSPMPSSTDEETFSRVFGPCDWSLMFILAKGGETYARLAFSAGPAGNLLLPVTVDWARWPRTLIDEVEGLTGRFCDWVA